MGGLYFTPKGSVDSGLKNKEIPYLFARVFKHHLRRMTTVNSGKERFPADDLTVYKFSLAKQKLAAAILFFSFYLIW